MSNKTTQAPKFSQSISEFCRTMDEAKHDFTWNSNSVQELDKLTQDYLHMLELGDLSYKERAKIATKLAECRKLRRASKDTVETLEPLITFLDSDKGKNMMNLMREVLGKTRKVEEKMQTRMYRCRVLENDAVEKVR